MFLKDFWHVSSRASRFFLTREAGEPRATRGREWRAGGFPRARRRTGARGLAAMLEVGGMVPGWTRAEAAGGQKG
jgi:hypothetical protein